MPEQGKPIEPNNDFTHKCYKVARKKKYRVSETWDDVQRKWVKPEDYERPKESEVNCPHIAKWEPEWSYMATGYRMGKKQLKEYCKKNNKICEN